MEAPATPKPVAGSLHQRRIDAVRLHAEGVPVMQIVARTGLGWAAVKTAIRLSETGGLAALKPGPRGPAPGTGRKLTADQETTVRNLVRRRLPWYYGLRDGLWSRGAVQRLVEQRLGITLTDHGLGNYLHRWGVEPTAPQQPVLQIQAWLSQHLEEMRALAGREDAEIYWLHKTSRLDAALWGYASASTGPGPPHGTGQGRILSSVSNSQGRLMWMIIHKGAFNSGRQRKLLDALVRHTARRTLYLVRSDATTFRDGTFGAPPNTVVKLFPKLVDGRLVSTLDSDVLHERFLSKGREGKEELEQDPDPDESASYW